MSRKLHQPMPCMVFFRAGRIATGVITLLMQLTVVLWPVAARMARKFSEQSGVQLLLRELSEKYQLPVERFPAPKKSFSQAA